MLRLKCEREKRGLTQQEVADQIGKKLRMYQYLETGKRKGTVDVWDRLEDLFDIPSRILREQIPPVETDGK